MSKSKSKKKNQQAPAPKSSRSETIKNILFTIILVPLISFAVIKHPPAIFTQLYRFTMTDVAVKRAPALFVPHGGGPMPLLKDPGHQPMVDFLTGPARKMLSLIPSDNVQKPKAILLVTAHWETSIPTISSGESHDLYYDYYGFPPETYEIKYPAPGSPSVATKVKELLSSAGFEVKLDPKRGWDHGVFVPLKILYPEADVPVVQMSVLRSQDAEEHIRLGRALAPLRDEGVVIVGSGMTFHNMMALRGGRGNGLQVKNNGFHEAITDACQSGGKERDEKLAKWETFPEAKYSHPEGAAEHFMPLLVVAGAGGAEKGERVLDWNASGHKLGAFIWK